MMSARKVMLVFRSPEEPIASIIIVGLRAAPTLLRCLHSVSSNVLGISYETRIVLCDPSERLLSDLKREVTGANITVFRANLGFAQAVNFAASEARGDFLVLLNDDCVVTNGWLDALLETVARHRQCGIVSSTYLYPDGTLQEAGGVLWSDGRTACVGDGLEPGYMDFERRVTYGSGGSLLVRRDVWDLLGGMPEHYYPAYYEDIDFCLSAAQAGWETWYQPASTVVHERSTSTNPIFRSFLIARSAEQFKRRWQNVLPSYEPYGQIERAVWHGMGCPTRILVIDERIPDPSMGTRFWQMRDTLASLACESDLCVSFHPRQAEGDTRLPVSGVRIIRDLKAHLSTDGVQYDVVVVSSPDSIRPDYLRFSAEIIDRYFPRAIHIFNADMLTYRRLEMQMARSTDETARHTDAEVVGMKESETSFARGADLVVCISKTEADLARSLTQSPVRVVSPRLDTHPTENAFHGRSGIGFVACWQDDQSAPNSDGLLWFAREVLPKVRARQPEAVLHVTGSNPPNDVRWMAGPQVKFEGEIGDLRSFYEGLRVVIFPRRLGAGLEIKVVEAIQFAVPLVCTSEAASSLPSALRNAVSVADRPDDFADSVADLLKNENAWNRLRERCLAAAPRPSIEDTDSEVWTWPAIIRDSRRQRSEVLTHEHR